MIREKIGDLLFGKSPELTFNRDETKEAIRRVWVVDAELEKARVKAVEAICKENNLNMEDIAALRLPTPEELEPPSKRLY